LRRRDSQSDSLRGSDASALSDGHGDGCGSEGRIGLMCGADPAANVANLRARSDREPVQCRWTESANPSILLLRYNFDKNQLLVQRSFVNGRVRMLLHETRVKNSGKYGTIGGPTFAPRIVRGWTRPEIR